MGNNPNAASLANLVKCRINYFCFHQASSDIENDDDKGNTNTANNEETDVSLSLAAEDESDEAAATKNEDNLKSDDLKSISDVKIDENVDVVERKFDEKEVVVKIDSLNVVEHRRNVDEDNSSHVDTDSLEENSNNSGEEATKDKKKEIEN